jgi:hypothetical protein
MTTGKSLLLSLGLGTLLLLSACSSSGGSDGGTLLGAQQNLGADPTGRTTDLTFSRTVPATLTPGNFEADGGQLPLAVVVVGQTATVTWDDRVTPSHMVRSVGISGIPATFIGVTTSNPNPPIFAISGGAQTAGLGGDSFTVQFTGANIVEATAEDVSNWELLIGGTALDLTGSTLAFDPGLQSMTFTLGAMANLHASFQLRSTGVQSVADVSLPGLVAGTATGDAVAPTLVSAVQNLDPGNGGSEFGFVVDFTFDEAMDPALNPLSGFGAGMPIFATGYEQPSEDVLRVTFTGPIIPGQDSIDLDGVIDAHGNPVATATVPITTGSTVANAFSGGTPTVATVANVGGDSVSIEFVQALDPDTAGLPASWVLESPTGTPIDLSTATFDHDFLGKALTITLNDVELQTGDSFTFGVSGAAPLDVDGEVFAGSLAGAVGGDVAVPTVVSVTQNRVIDPSGLTLDVQLSEDVDAVQAEMTANYSVDSGATITSATLLPTPSIVRLAVDTLTIPDQHTVDVSSLVDLAGNAMAPVVGQALGSTDTVAPVSLLRVAFADAGDDNDTVTVEFDDELISAEVTNPANWIFESPTGNPLDTSLASVTWTGISREAVLTFDGGDGINLKRDDTFTLSFTTMRDLAGNIVDGTPVNGIVLAENDDPELASVWVEAGDATKLHVRFDEPVELFDDPLTQYVIRDAMGLDVGGGTPTIVPDADGQGAEVTFAVGVVPGTHTLDIRGVADLAGNVMFPVESHPISAENAMAPLLAAGSQVYTAVSGEDNDTIAIVFDQPMSPWRLMDPANYSLTNGMDVADFGRASFSFDGVSTVTVDFDNVGAINFDNGAYTLTVDGVLSSQGRPMAAPSMDTAVADPGTDTAPAAPVAGRTRLDAQDTANSVLIEMDEAVDPTEALDPLNYAIGAVNPDSVALLGHRSIRATWSGGVSAGQMVDVTVADLAGNAGLVTEAIQLEDSAGPAVIGVAGVVAPRIGGDYVEVTFSVSVDQATATLNNNYTIMSGGQTIDVSQSLLSYSSVDNMVRIPLPDSVDLLESDTITVMVSNVLNHAGLPINPPANVNGSISGDGVPPAFQAAFANVREDATGRVIDVRFDEDVDSTFAGVAANYVLTGGQLVMGIEMIRPDTARLSLDVPLLTGDRVQVTALPDPAGNTSGAIEIEPVL